MGGREQQTLLSLVSSPERSDLGRGPRKPLRKFQKSRWALPGAQRKPVCPPGALSPRDPPLQARFGDVIVCKTPVLL